MEVKNVLASRTSRSHTRGWRSGPVHRPWRAKHADGHAKYRTQLSIRSSDFGLMPDRAPHPNDGIGCDGRLKRAFW